MPDPARLAPAARAAADAALATERLALGVTAEESHITGASA